MPTELSAPVAPISDLPPRTWRGWWLAWPKWVRIGCWTACGLAVLHVALAIWSYSGRQPSPEIVDMQKRGIDFRYSWEKSYARCSALSPYLAWYFGGLWRESWSNVTRINAYGAAMDADVRWIADHAFNLEVLDLSECDISSGAIRALASCRHLQVFNLADTDADDAAVERLKVLGRLSALNLRGTLVSDSVFQHLGEMPALRGVDLCYTDVTFNGLHRWRGLDSGIMPIVASEQILETDVIVGSIRWADGKRSAGFAGGTINYQVEHRPLDSKSEDDWELATSSRGPGLGRETMSYVPDRSGEFRVKLTINEYESRPVIVVVGAGSSMPRSIEFQMPCTKAEALRSCGSDESP